MRDDDEICKGAAREGFLKFPREREKRESLIMHRKSPAEAKSEDYLQIRSKTIILGLPSAAELDRDVHPNCLYHTFGTTYSVPESSSEAICSFQSVDSYEEERARNPIVRSNRTFSNGPRLGLALDCKYDQVAGYWGSSVSKSRSKNGVVFNKDQSLIVPSIKQGEDTVME
uniref:SFRICE_022747 n=1 Tax=Spodoptera frugiperda TaxID=7108 RepID=A0A2H1WXB9_SPOFR